MNGEYGAPGKWTGDGPTPEEPPAESTPPGKNLPPSEEEKLAPPPEPQPVPTDTTPPPDPDPKPTETTPPPDPEPTETTPPPPPPLPTSGSGDWWTQAHWDALAEAIGYTGSPGTFGRNPDFERYGSYSDAARALQNYLNSHDGGLPGTLEGEGMGYWGPKTTEKLRQVIDYRCDLPYKLLTYQVIDGNGANGTVFTFNDDEAGALAECLNKGAF
jgi:hypothetical protein